MNINSQGDGLSVAFLLYLLKGRFPYGAPIWGFHMGVPYVEIEIDIEIDIGIEIKIEIKLMLKIEKIAKYYV
ncbi:MAG: hypothetical protein IJV71_01335 [Lachnospiraceae bacterium]|nr:hypothetical protein [Lachnospiraceae bacterium]